MLERPVVSAWVVKTNEMAKKNVLAFVLRGDAKVVPAVSEWPTPSDVWLDFYNYCYNYYLAYFVQGDFNLIEDVADIPLCIMPMQMVKAVQKEENIENKKKRKNTTELNSEGKRSHPMFNSDNVYPAIVFLENNSSVESIQRLLPPRSKPQERLMFLFSVAAQINIQLKGMFLNLKIGIQCCQSISSFLDTSAIFLTEEKKILSCLALTKDGFMQDETNGSYACEKRLSNERIEIMSQKIAVVKAEYLHLNAWVIQSYKRIEELGEINKVLQKEFSPLSPVFQSNANVAPPFFNRPLAKKGNFDFNAHRMGNDSDTVMTIK